MAQADSIPEDLSSTAKAPSRAEGPAFAEPEDAVVDLSREIVRVIPRVGGEHVTCRRVSGNHYRCNWWRADTHGGAGQAMTGLVVTTHRVSRSGFLHVTRKGKELQIAADPPIG